jgi:hypothetical protein
MQPATLKALSEPGDVAGMAKYLIASRQSVGFFSVFLLHQSKIQHRARNCIQYLGYRASPAGFHLPLHLLAPGTWYLAE